MTVVNSAALWVGAGVELAARLYFSGRRRLKSADSFVALFSVPAPRIGSAEDVATMVTPCGDACHAVPRGSHAVLIQYNAD